MERSDPIRGVRGGGCPRFTLFFLREYRIPSLLIEGKYLRKYVIFAPASVHKCTDACSEIWKNMLFRFRLPAGAFSDFFSVRYNGKVVQNHTSRIFAKRLKKLPWDPSFWRGFWNQNRPNIKKKWFRNLYKNQVDFSSDFESILAPFWTSWATPKSIIFHQSLLLVSLLGHLGAKRAPKVLQDGSGGRYSKNLVPFWVNL